MKEKLVSEGKCLYCGKTFSKREIGKHLDSHLSKMETEDSSKKPVTYCHIVVEADVMFLHLLVKGNATMEKIDKYLRAIWLECCGHCSNFGYKNDEIPMKQKVFSVFGSYDKIFHEYDYGTTTTVNLKELNNYKLNHKEDILLLSRNEPLRFLCSKCGKKPAVNVCTVCNYDMFCETCSLVHETECDDFDDYANMPVVNSPRMGECGYMGGEIDLERDGYFKQP